MKEGWSGAAAHARANGWSSQDAPVVVDDQELEPAREHRLAVGEQHLPAERHNVAAEAGGRGGAIANALATGLLSGRREGEPRERGVSARARYGRARPAPRARRWRTSAWPRPVRSTRRRSDRRAPERRASCLSSLTSKIEGLRALGFAAGSRRSAGNP